MACLPAEESGTGPRDSWNHYMLHVHRVLESTKAGSMIVSSSWPNRSLLSIASIYYIDPRPSINQLAVMPSPKPDDCLLSSLSLLEISIFRRWTQ